MNCPEPVELPADEVELHPIAERHREELEKAKPGELGFVSIKGSDLFACDVISDGVKIGESIACSCLRA